MSILSDLKDFLKANPKAKTPFWPGARYTNRVDIRTSQRVLDMGGSPLHAGVDRSQGREFIQPFDGRLEWKLLPADSQIGSVLMLRPINVEFVIQVFHTEGPAGVAEYEEDMKKGDRMPVNPGKLGLSLGVHTHTEVLFPYDKELLAWLRRGAEIIISPDGEGNIRYIIAHSRRYNLKREQLLLKIPGQIARWQISEMTNRYMVRQAVGPDRIPPWGQGPVILVDSKWLLDI